MTTVPMVVFVRCLDVFDTTPGIELLVDVYVPGQPQRQGSTAHVGGGKVVNATRGLPRWRKQVLAEARAAYGAPLPEIRGPVMVAMRFDFVPPGRPVHPDYPMGREGDLDKLERAAHDALGGSKLKGVFKDDRQVVLNLSAKRFVSGTPGMRLWVYQITESVRGPSR